MSTTYELGQIIYVLSNKTQTVVPAIVTEEFVHKKLNGNLVTYKVAIGPSGKQKIVELEKIDGEVFTSLDEIRTTLTTRLTGFVNELITNTEDRVRTWYGNQGSQKDVPESKNLNEKIDPQSFLEPQASYNTSQIQNFMPAINQSGIPAQVTNLRSHLRSLVNPAEEETKSDIEEETGLVSLPDGRQVKAKIHINNQ